EPYETNEQLESQVWDQLLLSYEAFRRNITVDDKEVAAEITKTLSNEKVNFDWQKDKEAYAKWVKEKTQEPVELFENQLKHLIQLEKLRQQVMDNIKPQVSQEEAHQEFLDEYNTLELELVQFDNLTDAQAFYNKMKNPKLWDAEAKKNPKFSKHPGFVSLQFLINMWGISRDDVYKMLKLDVNSIYPPAKIYKGHYGVFRILKKRPAQEEDFAKLKDSYLKRVELIKKYEGVKDWLKKLREDAKIVVYPKPAQEPEAKAKK
ncbi:MAG: hypothetical protein PHN57_08730, partial [Candidatus Omnitrophica bacterium]|nr:hypothetical protein [Candidatus Omnitrophota bacterium]